MDGGEDVVLEFIRGCRIDVDNALNPKTVAELGNSLENTQHSTRQLAFADMVGLP